MDLLSNNPPKGTSDWFPDEFKVRKYIFDTWRKVCESFGYEEYLTPVFEKAEIYKAKSGEDIGGKELMIMTDKAGRELAVRPEMTPSVTRMVTRNYNGMQKPVRYFSIANFVRNEKPQRGRNREFWQLNADIFGSSSLKSDIEVLTLGLEIMFSFNSPEGSFVLNINNRKLIDGVLSEVAGVGEDIRTEVVRTLDKFEKLESSGFKSRLSELGLSNEVIGKLELFMNSKSASELVNNLPELESNEGYKESVEIMNTLSNLGYSKWINFDPSIIRGFDYYDGMVFEVFDKHPDNNRSLFGGGRYNGLAKLFVNQDIPATGFAPGDETTKLFLEAWDLIPQELFVNNTIFIPLLDENASDTILEIAQSLRSEGMNVETGVEKQAFGKALNYADKKGFRKVIIVGENEIKEGLATIKNMETGNQESLNSSELLNHLIN